MRSGADVEQAPRSARRMRVLPLVWAQKSALTSQPPTAGLDGRYDRDLHEQPRIGEVADLHHRARRQVVFEELLPRGDDLLELADIRCVNRRPHDIRKRRPGCLRFFWALRRHWRVCSSMLPVPTCFPSSSRET